jgi:TldD protein
MKKVKDTAKELFRLFGLTPAQLDRVVAKALEGREGNGLYCDVYLEAGADQSLTFDQGVLKNTSYATVRGAGVRVVIGEKTGYSYTSNPNITELLRCAKVARGIAEYADKMAVVPHEAENPVPHQLYNIGTSPVSIDLVQKLELLRKCDAEARKHDKRIFNVSANVSTSARTIIIATSFGDVILDERPMVRLNVNCLAQDGDRIESGNSGGGGRVDFAKLAAEDFWKEHAQTAAKQAITNLSSVPTPAGEMTVVLGNGWPGVLIHEAVGHGLEGDFNRKGTSAFSGKIGQKVASELCTIIDDGQIPDRRGSLNVDDEGTPTTQTVLIEKGILRGYMQDRQNASLMGKARTGNGRRESYKHVPMPRMTNTFLGGGQHTHDEIIASVDRGIYAETFGGGQVDITSGDFTFSCTTAWLIENGKLTVPLKGATLIGNGPKALHHVSMVGNNAELDTGIGVCGKSGQGVPVGVGMPTVRINNVTVGGTGK